MRNRARVIIDQMKALTDKYKGQEIICAFCMRTVTGSKYVIVVSLEVDVQTLSSSSTRDKTN